MTNSNKDMILFITLLKGTLKMCLAWFGTMAVFQQVLNKDLFNFLMEAMPSQVAMFFGFFYLLFIVIKKGHDTYIHIQLNRVKLNKEKEALEQEEIHTQKNRKELEK